MKNTSKLKLNLPEYSDVIDIQKLNDNFTILDTEVDSKAKASDLASHTGDKNNPHAVTKDQVGLGNVDNTADTAKPVSTAQAKAISDAVSAHGGDTSAHSDIRDAVNSALEAAEAAQEAAESVSPAETYDIVIAKSGWVADATYGGYGFKYSYSMDSITDDSVVDLSLDPAGVDAALEAGMLNTPESVDGFINFYSESIPDTDLIGRIMVFVKAPASSIIEGIGDMMASVYDPQGKRTDVFAYVDNAVGNIPMPDVSGQIMSHNTDGEAHADIRGEVTAAYNRAQAAHTMLDSKANVSHIHSAIDIVGDSFGGAVFAKSSAQDPDLSLLRNSMVVNYEWLPSHNGEIVWNYK